MRKYNVWMAGLVMMANSVISVAQAQEPALNVQPPVSAPILDSGSSPAPANEAPVPTAEKPVNVAEVPVVVPDAPVIPVVPVVTPVPANVAETPSQSWNNTSWQVGTRYTEVQLQDKSRGTPGDGSFFGTITGITEEQDGWPNKAYVQYRLFKSPVWLGVSYDHVTARTMDDSNGDGVADLGGGDGSEEIQGVIPYLQAAWDNKSRFSPYVQAGLGFYQAEFKPNSWGNNGQRFVEAKSNVTGVELAGGLNIRLYKNLSADIFAKYMKVDDIAGDWFFNYGNNYGGPFIMTMSYVAYGAGLNLRF
jgi:opacity protein-like surface antigen